MAAAALQQRKAAVRGTTARTLYNWPGRSHILSAIGTPSNCYRCRRDVRFISDITVQAASWPPGNQTARDVFTASFAIKAYHIAAVARLRRITPDDISPRRRSHSAHSYMASRKKHDDDDASQSLVVSKYLPHGQPVSAFTRCP